MYIQVMNICSLEVDHEIPATASCPDANDLCEGVANAHFQFGFWGEQVLCTMGSKRRVSPSRMQIPFLDPSDEPNLPKSLMLKGNFISLVLIPTGFFHLKN